MKRSLTIDEALHRLRLHRPVDEESVKSAYRALVKQCHPDRVPSYDKQVWATNEFIRVQQAYEFISTQDLASINKLSTDPHPEVGRAETKEERGIFDLIYNRDNITKRDFVSFLALWRLLLATILIVAKPFLRVCGRMSEDAMAIGGVALGCLIMLLTLPALFFFTYLSGFLLNSVYIFAMYIGVQKTLLSGLESFFKCRIGPDSENIFGELLYLLILSFSAAPVAYFIVRWIPRMQGVATEGVIISYVVGAAVLFSILYEFICFTLAHISRSRIRQSSQRILALIGP